MKLTRLLALTALLVASPALLADSAAPRYVAAAIAAPDRPPTDRDQDAQRKPDEVLAFAGVKPGDVVVDLMPGSGYYTRLLSGIVGPSGKVYALQPQEMDKAAPKGLLSLRGFAGKPPYANVIVLVQPVSAMSLPEPVDLIWTSQNYHDLHDPFMGSPDIARLDHGLFEALKPGGRLLVLDHVAAAGSGTTRTDDLHRIDPSTVRRELVAAGFKPDGESDALHNPSDPHTAGIYDPSVRGHTDRFILRFRKP